MSLVIGADVGGSKTVVVAEVDGRIHARVRAAGAALRPDMILRSATTIADAIRRSLVDTGRISADVVVVGAAGARRREEAHELARALRADEQAQETTPHHLVDQAGDTRERERRVDAKVVRQDGNRFWCQGVKVVRPQVDRARGSLAARRESEKCHRAWVHSFPGS